MNMSKLLAILTAVLMLTACVGFIVPIPLNNGSDGAAATDQAAKR